MEERKLSERSPMSTGPMVCVKRSLGFSSLEQILTLVELFSSLWNVSDDSKTNSRVRLKYKFLAKQCVIAPLFMAKSRP